jgi:hypothetical protein
MSPDPKSPATDKHTSISLETEPLSFFHPTLAGLSPPGAVQPVHATLLLEEEPAPWPQLDG